MRQHILNGWLAAALAALVCLLGATAYIEIREDIPHVACAQDNSDVRVPVARCESCGPPPCDHVAPKV